MPTRETYCRVKPAPSVFFRDFDGEMVLLDLGRGEYFGLNPVGATIWHAIVEGRSNEEAAALVAREYEVDAARSHADVEALVSELVARGLVVPA